jgi:hypothetical protein
MIALCRPWRMAVLALVVSLAACSFKGRHAPVLRSFRFAIRPQRPGVPAEIAAISTAVGQLADGLGSMLLAGPVAQ